MREKIKGLELVWKGYNLGPLTASLGVVAFPVHADSLEGVMKVADQALYLSKAKGRDRVSGGADL